MTRVTFVALKSYSLVGGLQQFNRRVVTALAKLASENNSQKPVIILSGDSVEHVASCNDAVIFKACAYSKLAILREIFIQSFKTDLMFLGHINLLPLALFAKCFKPDLKIVLFVHGDDVWNDPAYRAKKRWDQFLIRFVDCISSVSSFTAKRMATEFNISSDKFYILPNAVDPLVEHLNVREAVHLSHPLILTVARIAAHDEGKHHDSVLRAMPKILREIPNARYRIIGDGVLRPKLEELASELNISHAVEFLGRVSDDVLATSYNDASVFVMPSEKEGFGIVFLEAWQRNVPVICGTEDASHEVITDGVDGFAIHHKDIERLSSKIIFLLRNPDRAKAMGQVGNLKVKQKYLMENFVRNLNKLITMVDK